MAVSQQFPRVDVLASTLVTGGAEKVVQALVRGLPGQGFEPRVLCLFRPGEIGDEMRREGVPFVAGIARDRLDPFAVARLSAVIRRRGSVIFLSLDHHNAIFYGAIAAWWAGVRHRIVAVHSTGLWGTGRTFSRSDRFVLGAYERVVALANAHADYLVEREGVHRGRITVINNGIDVETYRPAKSDEDRMRLRAALGLAPASFVVDVVAALRPEKNHEMLLEAAALFLKIRQDAVFLIVGEGTEAAKLRAKARELGIASYVRFMGRRNDVPDILAASDALVLCSHRVVETFPLVVLEAMAASLPVVVTDVGAVREMFGDGTEGVVIPPGDREALSRTLLELAESPMLRRTMGAAARRRVARDFSAERMIARYGELFRGLLGNAA